MQTHGDVRHAYEMTEEVKQIYRNFTRLHTELIPYMQKYSKIACDTGMPPVRHLVLKYMNDVKVYDLIDEFLLGDGLLVAPILTKDTFEREVYLPESVKIIGPYAFHGCKNLERIHLPSHLYSIGEKAFARCYSMKQIEVPQDTIIGYQAFYMTRITVVRVPRS